MRLEEEGDRGDRWGLGDSRREDPDPRRGPTDRREEAGARGETSWGEEGKGSRGGPSGGALGGRGRETGRSEGRELRGGKRGTRGGRRARALGAGGAGRNPARRLPLQRGVLGTCARASGSLGGGLGKSGAGAWRGVAWRGGGRLQTIPSPYQRVEGGRLGAVGHVVAVALRAAVRAPVHPKRRGRVELVARGGQQPALVDRAVDGRLGRGGGPRVGQRAAAGLAARAQGVGGHQELGERGAARKGRRPGVRGARRPGHPAPLPGAYCRPRRAFPPAASALGRASSSHGGASPTRPRSFHTHPGCEGVCVCGGGPKAAHALLCHDVSPGVMVRVKESGRQGGARTSESLGAPALPGAGCKERLAQAPLSGKRPRVAGQPASRRVRPRSPHPRGAPLPGVRRNRGIQTAGRTWRGRRGLARGRPRGAATAPGPPAPRRWEGEAEERVNSSTRPANFSNPVGK